MSAEYIDMASISVALCKETAAYFCKWLTPMFLVFGWPKNAIGSEANALIA